MDRDVHSFQGRPFVLLLVMAVLVMAGCSSKESPPAETPDPSPSEIGSPLILLTFHESASTAAPGNAIAFHGQREGGVLHVAASAYSERVLYYGRLNGSNLTVERIAPRFQDNEYAEQLALGVLHGQAMLAYRVGLTRLELQFFAGNEWREAVLADLDVGVSGRGVVTVPRFGVSDSEIILGYGIHGPEGTSYQALRLTDMLTAESIKYQSQSIPTTASLVAGAIGMDEGDIVVAYPSSALETSFARWTFGDAFQSQVIWTDGLPEGLTREDALSLTTHPRLPVTVLRQPLPWAPDMPTYQPVPIHIAQEPEWTWKDTGILSMDFSDISYAGDRLFFTGRPTPTEYAIYEWNVTAGAQEVLRASCPLALVKNATAPEALALADDPRGITHELRHVPAALFGTDQDPCQGVEETARRAAPPSGGFLVARDEEESVPIRPDVGIRT